MKGALGPSPSAREERGSLSEDVQLRIGTVLTAAALIMTIFVLCFCERQDEALAKAGIELNEIIK